MNNVTPHDIQRYAATLAPEAQQLATRKNVAPGEKQKRLNAAVEQLAHILAVLKLGE